MNYHISFNLDFKRNTYLGKFIVIEGIDGSGKTTQAKRVVKRLSQTIYTKEPTDGPIGKFVRRVLSQEVRIPAVSFQHLLASDRAAHEEEIKKFLSKSITIVSDRYFWSSVAYGMADREGTEYSDGKVLLVAQSILSMYHQFIVPDLTLYLDVSIDTALKRLAKMNKTKELYERRDKLEKVAKGYAWLVKQFSEEIVVVDGEQEVDKVTADILGKVSSIM